MSDTIDILGAPNIPGLVFRRLRGEGDLPALVAVHAGREAYDQLDPRSPNQRTPTVEELKGLFLDNPAFDADSQILVAEVSGQVVGYAWIRTWASSEDRWVLEHSELLLPAWRGKGIGKALLGWAEAVLGYAAQQRPHDVAAHYQTTIFTTEYETIARLESANYEQHDLLAVMNLDMLDILAEPTIPANVVLKAPSLEECREAYFLLQGIFADLSTEHYFDEETFVELMLDDTTDPSLWCVAMADGKMVGAIICEIRGEYGFVAELGVLFEWGRQGIGHALLLAGLKALRERGITRAFVITDGDESKLAHHLYMRVGFFVNQHVREYVKPIE